MNAQKQSSARGRRTRALVFLMCASVVVVLDQISKATIRNISPRPGFISTLIPGILNLVHVENTGAAFSIGEGAAPVFIVAALAVACGAFAFVLYENLPLPLVVSIACVAGGGIGNLIDRVAFGSVTDFLSTAFMSFPIFNVADIFVTVGIVASFVGYLVWEMHIKAGD